MTRLPARRSLATVAAIAAIATGAAACGNGGGGSSSNSSSGSNSGTAAAKGTINFWVRVDNPSVGLAKQFNATHKNVHVNTTVIPDAEYVTKMAAAVRGHSGPDVADFDDINTPLFAATGITQNVTSYLNSLPFKSSLNKAEMGLASYKGGYYGVPYINGSSVMMYNKGLFRKAGLDPNKPPATWAQILTDAKKISALGNGVSGFTIPGACGGCTVYTVWPLIWASSGQVLSSFGANQTTTFGQSPPVAAALKFYRELWTSGTVASKDRSENGTTWGAAFMAGKTGILLGTPVDIPTARKNGVDVGVAPIPGQNGGYSTFVGGDELGVINGSKNLAADKEFITWMLGVKQQEYVANPWFLVPVRQDMLTASFASKYPDAAVGLKASEKGQVPKSIGFTAATEDANSPWVTAFEQVVFSGANPSSTLKSADTNTKQILAQQYQQQVGG
jgi:multiple sugar transport system substrate-binding protein